MKTVIITRKKKFASALVPYWIVSAEAVAAMPSHFQKLDQVRLDFTGHAIPSLPVEELGRIGIPIANGETVRFEVQDGEEAIYAVTMDGLLSNPGSLSGSRDTFRFTVTTKGGFVRPPHPILEPEQDDST